jgi:site-specific DNA-methyltransferase (adenine-specific)
MELNKVHNLDFLNNDLPDKCAKLIIADPPYYKTKGEFDFIWTTFEDYLIDVEKWCLECKRILADNGTLFWYGGSKNIAYAQIIFDKHFNLINNLTWNKGSFMGLEESEGLRSFAPCTERILMYSNETYNLTQCVFMIRDYIREEIIKAKGKIVLKHVNEALGTATNGGGVASACLSLDKAEPTMLTKEMYQKLQTWCKPYLTKEYEELRKEYEELRKEYEELRRPFNNRFNLQEVLNYSNEAVKVGNKYDHDTVKPETLTRALILTCTRENDLVIVPFSGSGTECAMSAKEKRPFIGYEITKKHADMSQARANKILTEPTMF